MLCYVCLCLLFFFFFFSSRRRHTRYIGDWSSDVCSSDLVGLAEMRSIRRGCPSSAFRRARRGRSAKGKDFPTRRSTTFRSEERRVGKEWRWRWSAEHEKKKDRKEGS